ncbi:MAG: glutathione S-transferase family protein [Hyphomicrobium sp.]|nr:glutathione S-transferase family protein [Hyphomicrobium sp.]
MYTVIGSPKSRAIRVMWMLEELGEPYTLDPKPPRDPSLVALNPTAKVPILKDGDAIVIDSVAICQYLADKHGKLTFPAGTIDRAHQDSFTQFAVDELEGALWTTAKHTFVLPKDIRIEAVKVVCKYDYDRGLAALSTRLADKTYVMGDQFTVPDLIIGHLLGWGLSTRWPIPEGNLDAYFERIRARPAYKTALARREAA